MHGQTDQMRKIQYLVPFSFRAKVIKLIHLSTKFFVKLAAIHIVILFTLVSVSTTTGDVGVMVNFLWLKGFYPFTNR